MNENRAYEITRYISKNGDMGLVSEDTIAWARSLPGDQKVVLYCKVRDESLRVESEWRSEFVERIGIADSEPPDAADGGGDLEEFLLWAAAHSDRGEVMDSLEDLLEGAPPELLATARKLINETGQTDLLPILDDYES